MNGGWVIRRVSKEIYSENKLEKTVIAKKIRRDIDKILDYIFSDSKEVCHK